MKVDDDVDADRGYALNNKVIKFRTENPSTIIIDMAFQSALGEVSYLLVLFSIYSRHLLVTKARNLARRN